MFLFVLSCFVFFLFFYLKREKEFRAVGMSFTKTLVSSYFLVIKKVYFGGTVRLGSVTLLLCLKIFLFDAEIFLGYLCIYARGHN